jgi:type IV pilus assembly protein PilQ
MILRYWGVFLLLLVMGTCQAQFSRIDELTEELETFSEDQKNLNRKIDISALGSVQEIITSIAQQTKINITIDPAIQQNIVRRVFL